MRVGVYECAARQQPAGSLDRLYHNLVGVARLAVRAVHRVPGEQWDVRQIHPVRPNGVGHRQPVRLPQLPVVGAMPRRDMDEPGAGVGSDEIGGQQRDVEVIALPVQRVTRHRAGKRITGKPGLDRMGRDPGPRRDLLD